MKSNKASTKNTGHPRRPLKLHRESVRELDANYLAAVAGAGPTNPAVCGAPATS